MVVVVGNVEIPGVALAVIGDRTISSKINNNSSITKNWMDKNTRICCDLCIFRFPI